MTFVLSDLEDPIVGEVYISIDRIKENSKEMKISYKTELIRVIIHSILHLCGYLDKPKSAAIKMHKTQEQYLRLCPVSRGT
jgi:rRNA maturation RNase YbeY